MKKLLSLLLVMLFITGCSFKYGKLKDGQTVRQLLAEKSVEELQEMSAELKDKNDRLRQTDYQQLLVEINMLIRDAKYKK
jgi:hypothetical protein